MAKKITRVAINPGCVSCGACQIICPKVFKIDGISSVNPIADLNENAACIKDAAAACPVGVISVIEDE